MNKVSTSSIFNNSKKAVAEDRQNARLLLDIVKIFLTASSLHNECDDWLPYLGGYSLHNSDFVILTLTPAD